MSHDQRHTQFVPGKTATPFDVLLTHKRHGVSSTRRRSVAGRPCYAAVQPGSDRVTNGHAETCTYTTPAYRADRLRVRKARKVSKASRRANR